MMIRAEFYIDGRKGELVFTSFRGTRDHLQEMIEFYGPRMTLGVVESCDTTGCGVIPAGGKTSLSPAAFSQR